MVVFRDGSSPARAARIATVLPAPTSPVTTPRARSLIHQLIRATASAWLVWWCSIWGARALPKGMRVNPYSLNLIVKWFGTSRVRFDQPVAVLFRGFECAD